MQHSSNVSDLPLCLLCLQVLPSRAVTEVGLPSWAESTVKFTVWLLQNPACSKLPSSFAPPGSHAACAWLRKTDSPSPETRVRARSCCVRPLRSHLLAHASSPRACDHAGPSCAFLLDNIHAMYPWRDTNKLRPISVLPSDQWVGRVSSFSPADSQIAAFSWHCWCLLIWNGGGRFLFPNCLVVSKPFEPVF